MMTEPVPTPDGIARRIRLQVERYNLSVPKAALACNLSQASFETYLYGKNMPGALALASLANGLRCPVGWLLTGEFRA
jgi:transcriptional regulator with XRE-family HTH domain